ncbi:PTS sugar transporter subunit IIA [Salinicoccus halodurans]|uniref:PTS system IIA component, Gat family n=1 Tax=Salinicoccus halodurans TaxID=407035 RepID=A0A0F7HJE6_9STAP|nr:PTS sugar transporter subunit IIA [Salinicoccus halodurans]AKG73484.1 hypothetical protein AAT16_04190 [Salinicoccus halodurans]SFK51284.1 PTS system IIA component, Gat family [Salinicoccus halodurans]
MGYGSLFDETLITLDASYSSQEDLFKNAAEHLVDLGYIEETYLEALVNREREFPTGLETKYCNIAIPHTDAPHIKHPFIYLIRLNENLKFKNMGDVNSEVAVKIVLFLGIKNPKKQISLLSDLMGKFEDEDISKMILNGKNEKELEQNLKKLF